MHRDNGLTGAVAQFQVAPFRFHLSVSEPETGGATAKVAQEFVTPHQP
jgi:hypothetical protein